MHYNLFLIVISILIQVQIGAHNIYMDISGVWLYSQSFIVIYWLSVII